IHSRIGCQCIGGRVNGKQRKINYRLESGDTVEILTSSAQEPNADWLKIVTTSKARNKIRAVLKENENKMADLGKELLYRRFKNRKLEVDEALLSKTIGKMGYKNTIEFFSALSADNIDLNLVIESYLDLAGRSVTKEEGERVSAASYTLQNQEDEAQSGKNGDVLVIGDNVKGMNYRLAKCCNPIFGDDVFGFVSAEGVIKVHRSDCSNAAHLRDKYPYRIIRTRWSGGNGGQFPATLRVVGKDDIGIVTNITSIINKEKTVSLRSISIDSHDGLFSGVLTVGVGDTAALNQLIKKISTVKGVKNVERNK
ncbi:MAG: TGS domain-containing protein, partial [Muribaculaceae bacterium]|nr:TGS domain-containing protein [Muribaculaceae bacterium]